MSRRFHYSSTLTFGVDDGSYCELEVDVSYAVLWGCAAQTSGPPERCWPAEPDEIDDLRVERVDGEHRPWNRGFGYISDADLAESICDKLEGEFPEMIAEAAEQRAAEREAAAEARAEELRAEARRG